MVWGPRPAGTGTARMPAMLGVAAILSFIVAFAVLRILLWRFGSFVLDEPNARSLHERPVPRTGGIAILAGLAVSTAFGGLEIWVPLAAALALAAVSFLDDLYRMPTAARLAAHVWAPRA